MIIYQHPTETLPPAWLAGALDLASAPARLGIIHAVGDPWMLGQQETEGHSLANGWKCWLASDIEPHRLLRNAGWVRVRDVEDADGLLWPAPLILDATGTRQFTVRYGGENWEPRLTPEQTKAENIALIARAAIAAAKTGGELDASAAASWAAQLLSVTMHVSPEVFGALALLDEVLILRVLSAATGIDMERADG